MRELVWEWRRRAWRRANPGKTSADYYVERFLPRLTRPASHANIGNHPAEPARTRAFAEQTLQHLEALGMTPAHRCVDYGCGSLHVGEVLIEYLDSGRYTGLDVTDAFYTDALHRFQPGWLAHNRPQLAVINEQTVLALQSNPPDYLVCTHVVILVPPGELVTFFRSMARLIGPATYCLLELELSARPRQGSESFFWHTEKRVASALESCGLEKRFLGTFPPIRDNQRDSTFVELVQSG